MVTIKWNFYQGSSKKRCRHSCRCQFHFRYSVASVEVCVSVHACVDIAQKHRQNFSVMHQMSWHLEIKWIQNFQVTAKMNKIMKWYLIYSRKFRANVCVAYFISNWNNERFQELSCCYNAHVTTSFIRVFHQNAHIILQEILYAFQSILCLVERSRIGKFFSSWKSCNTNNNFIHSMQYSIMSVWIVMLCSLLKCEQFQLKTVQDTFQVNQTILCTQCTVCTH